MKIFEIPQYSPDWWSVRCGIPTASNFHRILTARGKLSKQADGYIAELIADSASLNPPFFTERNGHTAEMRNGMDCEPEARRFYELERSVDVREVGFCLSDCGRWGASPDGLVGDDGCLELKAPARKTQVGYLLKATIPAEYRPQVHGQLIVTGRKWVDFLSYAAGLAPLLIRVEPDDYTVALKSALEDFWSRYQELKARLIQREPGAEG